jgi:hypothetical protein
MAFDHFSVTLPGRFSVAIIRQRFNTLKIRDHFFRNTRVRPLFLFENTDGRYENCPDFRYVSIADGHLALRFLLGALCLGLKTALSVLQKWSDPCLAAKVV